MRSGSIDLQKADGHNQIGGNAKTIYFDLGDTKPETSSRQTEGTQGSGKKTNYAQYFTSKGEIQTSAFKSKENSIEASVQ